MKLLILGAIFIGVPLWLLQTFVMPQLDGLKNFYGDIDQIAQHAVTSGKTSGELR